MVEERHLPLVLYAIVILTLDVLFSEGTVVAGNPNLQVVFRHAQHV